jgi:hypothetical protein
MAYDFPGSPNLGDTFTDTASGVTFKWNGYGWDGGAPASSPAVIVSPTPPANPVDNVIWWESDTGIMHLRYNDGNSTQWVQLNAPAGMGYYVSKSGDAMSGDLVLSGSSPATPASAVPKSYSDTKLAKAGVSDGSDAPAGQIGEVIQSTISTGVSLTSNVVTAVGSIVLTPGDWDVSGEVQFTVGTGAPTNMQAALNTASGAFPGTSTPATSVMKQITTITASTTPVLGLRAARASVAVNTTYYLLAFLVFPSGVCSATGNIWARRAR